MRSWFGRRLVTDPTSQPADGLTAYREGRADEHQQLRRDGVHVDRATNDAYEHGRRDEQLRHRGSPILAIVTFILVIIAIAVLVLAVKTGSFRNAGAVLDDLIQNPAHVAAAKAGSALEKAGQDLKGDAPPTNQP